MIIQGKTEQRARDWMKSRTPYAAAAAKSLQSRPTLCDPIDGSPPGSPIPGILQARTLEWVAISFSNAWNWKVKVKVLSLDTTDILDWIILCGGYHPVYHDVFSSIFGFYALDAGSLLVVTTQKIVSRHYSQCPSRGRIILNWESLLQANRGRRQSERKQKVCGRKKRTKHIPGKRIRETRVQRLAGPMHEYNRLMLAFKVFWDGPHPIYSNSFCTSTPPDSSHSSHTK